ncbi:dihydroxy-acid dehydratase, partial [Nostoc sp. NIES-2111]
RISDARMSGTSFGTVVLHISPEAAAGGALGAVQTGDEIRLDVAGRQIELLVDEATLGARMAARRTTQQRPARGYAQLFWDHVEQAHLGCDFDFLKKNP